MAVLIYLLLPRIILYAVPWGGLIEVIWLPLSPMVTYLVNIVNDLNNTSFQFTLIPLVFKIFKKINTIGCYSSYIDLLSYVRISFEYRYYSHNLS
jgi:hypothetical protein